MGEPSDKENKVCLMFKAEAGAESMNANSQTKLVKFDRKKPFSSVVDYLNRKLKIDSESNPLFIYIDKFCPSLDESVGVLFEAYKQENPGGSCCLMVSYAPKAMYG